MVKEVIVSLYNGRPSFSYFRRHLAIQILAMGEIDNGNRKLLINKTFYQFILFKHLLFLILRPF